MFIQKSDKATHQNSSWIAASLQFTFQVNKQLQSVSSATYQAERDNKRNLQSVKAFLESQLSLLWPDQFSEESKTNRTWLKLLHVLVLKSLSCRASSAKEKNNGAPDISQK